MSTATPALTAYACPACGFPWGVVVDERLSGGAFEVLDRSFVCCARCRHVQRWNSGRRRGNPLDTGGTPKQE